MKKRPDILAYPGTQAFLGKPASAKGARWFRIVRKPIGPAAENADTVLTYVAGMRDQKCRALQPVPGFPNGYLKFAPSIAGVLAAGLVGDTERGIDESAKLRFWCGG